VLLSDREIRAALERGAVRITPTPSLAAFSSTALDLTLGPELRIWPASPEGRSATQVRPSLPGFSITGVLEHLTQPLQIPNTGYELLPGSFVLGWTAERIQLPHCSRLAARVEGKSSMARLGLGIHVTAPTIHAGFGYKEDDSGYEGSALQLEIWNIGNLAIVLDPGIAICQLLFEEVHGTPEKGYTGRFGVQGPMTPLPPPNTPAPAPRKRRRR
jgi:dCTP deaminase